MAKIALSQRTGNCTNFPGQQDLGRFNPAYMIAQSHNVTDPIESMISTVEAIDSCMYVASTFGTDVCEN